MDKETLLSDSLQNRLAYTEGYQEAEKGKGRHMAWDTGDGGGGGEVDAEDLSSLSVSWNPRIVSRMYVAFVTRSVFFPVLGHSMMDTLAVALRVAEEAIEEAISKAESHGDSLVGPPSYGGARVRRWRVGASADGLGSTSLYPPARHVWPPLCCCQDRCDSDPTFPPFSFLHRTSRTRPATCGTTRKSWLRSWPPPSCRG